MVIIWTFGLPRSTYEDNAQRGLFVAFELVEAMEAHDLDVSVGVTSGVTPRGCILVSRMRCNGISGFACTPQRTRA